MAAAQAGPGSTARQLAARALLCLAATAAPSTASSARAEELPLVDLLRELDGPGGMDAVARVQILRLDTSAEYRVAASEGFLNDNAQTRCEMAFTPAMSADFLLALHTAAPEVSSEGADLRWGAIFLDRQGIPMHRLYVNGKYFLVGLGRLGHLDGIGVAFKSGMGPWFQRTLAACRTTQKEK
jgi:hypothetical protein